MCITILAKNSAFNKTEPYVSLSGQYVFTTPTADTRVMIHAARQVLAKIYKDQVRYAKAGVMLSDICQHDEVQQDLFDRNNDDEKSQKLMQLMDTLNAKTSSTKTAGKERSAALFFASEGIRDKQTWQMSRAFLSPCYTTRIEDVVGVR